MKKAVHILMVVFLSVIFFFPASGANGSTELKYKVFFSEASNDGIIINSLPKTISDYYAGGQGKEITMGWNASGYAMRGFISFNATAISPSNGSILIIDSAVLTVYESNTNLRPFAGDDINRSVECYLLNYEKLDTALYNIAPVTKCGTIATTGYSVLTEHSLNVTSDINKQISANTSVYKFIFRLQFTNDDNVNSTNPLSQAMWNVFSGDETRLADYRPKLIVKYHYQLKK